MTTKRQYSQMNRVTSSKVSYIYLEVLMKQYMQSELSTIARIQDPQEQEKQFLAFIKNHPELV